MKAILSTLLLGAALALIALDANGANAPYAGIPPGFDYPHDKADLERLRANPTPANYSALRLHSWMLFAGLTQTAPDGTPNWETWYREDEAFTPPKNNAPIARPLTLPFKIPAQFEAHGLGPHAPGQSLLSFVLFNKESFDHIQDPAHPLYSPAELNRENAAYPANTPWDKRIIPAFPNRAMSLKVIWWPVAGDQMSKLPVWDNQLADPTKPVPFPKWDRAVAIDGTRQHVPDGETTTKFPMPHHPTATVVGRDRFYLVPVDQAIMDAINNGPASLRAAPLQSFGRSLQLGDYIAFIGFHMTTKEIDDWTWSTFWWHDKPNDGPFAADRPAQVAGVWRNYLMTIADDEVTPTEPDGSPHVGYNPYLETSFPAGTMSNCMACHHAASMPPPDTFLPVRRGKPNPGPSAQFPQGDPLYQPGRLRTDFLWSIPDNAQNAQ